LNDDNNNVDIDLDEFSTDFFQTSKPVATEPAEPKEEVEDEPEAETEDDALATEPVSEDDEPEVKPEPKPKKTAQERINEVVAKQREAERRNDELLARIAELEAATTKKPEVAETSTETPLRAQLPADAPNPDAQNSDGSPKYPLGEFDREYIRDLTKYTIAEERKAADAAKREEDEANMVRATQEKLQQGWLEKVNTVEAELPDLREKLGAVEEAFVGIDPDYGEFLAGTIMSCDNGPQIMYYLSQNIDEAKKIVASGPAAATRYLGRLDAKFDKPTGETRTKKPSSAPEPAPSATRGAGGKFTVSGDTDDLDAFTKVFFKK
jgi:hypothetical protein